MSISPLIEFELWATGRAAMSWAKASTSRRYDRCFLRKSANSSCAQHLCPIQETSTTGMPSR